jgi:acyl carrier protein
MDEFLKKIADILEVDKLKAEDDLKSFSQWDSLSVLAIIAMLDANYGVNLHAADLQAVSTAGDLWKSVQSKKSS